MKRISTLIIFFILLLEKPAFADAGPIHILFVPAYFIFIGFLVFLACVYILEKVAINMIKLIKEFKVTTKRKVDIKKVVIWPSMVLLIGFMEFIINRSFFHMFIIFSCFSFISGLVLVHKIKKFSKDTILIKEGQNIFKYSIFGIGLNLIFIIGWWKVMSFL